MKTNNASFKVRLLSLNLLLAAGLLLGTAPAQADPVVTTGTQWTADSGTQAPGTENYFTGTTYRVLPNFLVKATGGNQYYVQADQFPTVTRATVIPAGETAPIVTGFLVDPNDGYSTRWMSMFTFQTINPSVSSFTVWILDSTTGEELNHNAAVGISVNGSENVVSQATKIKVNSLEWTQFKITGASPSDVFTVKVQGDGTSSKKVITGLAFDTK